MLAAPASALTLLIDVRYLLLALKTEVDLLSVKRRSGYVKSVPVDSINDAFASCTCVLLLPLRVLLCSLYTFAYHSYCLF